MHEIVTSLGMSSAISELLRRLWRADYRIAAIDWAAYDTRKPIRPFRSVADCDAQHVQCKI
jgi:hypothetical protein